MRFGLDNKHGKELLYSFCFQSLNLVESGISASSNGIASPLF